MVNLLDISNYIAAGLCVILSLVILNWLLVFYRYRKIRIISSRRPTSSIIIGCISFIGLLYERSTVYIYYNLTNPINVPYWETVATFIFFSTYMLSSYIVTYRAFIFYYHISFNQALEDSKWRLFIDPKETENNWFLKHKASFKKITTIISCIIFTFWFLCSIFTVYWVYKYQFTTNIHRGTTLIALIVPTILDAILLCKFPKYDDIFYIRKEVKSALIIELIMIGIFIIVSMVLDSKGGTFAYLIQATAGAIMEFLYGGMVTGYVLYKNKLPSNICTVYCCKGEDHEQIMLEIRGKCMPRSNTSDTELYDMGSNDNEAEHGNDIPRACTLKEILEDQNGFSLFARHLSREFSVENLLFFLETTQWLEAFSNEYSKHIKDHRNQLSADGDVHIMFPDNAPISRIINATARITEVLHLDINNGDTSSVKVDDNGMIIAKYGAKYNGNKSSDDEEMEMKTLGDNKGLTDYDDIYYLQCIRIFNKYIANDSFFCINISGGIRKGLYDLIDFNDYDKLKEMDLVSNLKENLHRNQKLFGKDAENRNGKRPSVFDNYKNGIAVHHEEAMQKQVSDLYKIYDLARDETYKLMDYAVERFKHTKRYKSWIQQRRK